MDAQQQQQEEQEGESGGGCAGDPCPATPMSPRRPAAMTKPGDGEAAAEEQGQVGGFQTPPGRRTRHSLSPVSQYHTHARRRQSAKPRVLAVLGDLHDADANADVGDEGAATVSPKSEASQEADDEDEEERECAICFSPFLNRSVHRTRCNHYFHRTCMVASRAAHINGCPCCRAQITPGMTPLDAVPGRNNLLTASDRDQIASRARAARRAVMARFLSRQGGAGGGTGQQQGQQRGQQQGHAHMRPRGAILEFDLLASPFREHAHSASLSTAFAAAEEEGMQDPLRARLAAIPPQPLSPETHGHRIDHGDDLPH